MTKKDDNLKDMNLISDNELNVSGGNSTDMQNEKEHYIKCSFCGKKYTTKTLSFVGESICPQCGFNHNVPTEPDNNKWYEFWK